MDRHWTQLVEDPGLRSCFDTWCCSRCPIRMTSVFFESNSRRICHSTSTSTLLALSASFNYNYAASDVLLMMTLSLHSFTRSSQAESIIAAVSYLALRRRWPTSCNVSSTRQHESSRTRASSTGHSLISGEVDRVLFRVCVPVFRCLHKMAPEYLSTYCQPVYGISGRRHLRSADRGHLVFPRVKLASYGGRSFAYAGPSNWNSLPAHLRDNSHSLSSF